MQLTRKRSSALACAATLWLLLAACGGGGGGGSSGGGSPGNGLTPFPTESTDTLPAAPAHYVPLPGSQERIGVLALLPANPRRLFVPEQIRLLETFASQIAVAIERAKGVVEMLRADEAGLSESEKRDREALLLRYYPALELGYRAAKAGGTAGAAMNAADEVAVGEFLAGRIPFPEITRRVAAALDRELADAADIERAGLALALLSFDDRDAAAVVAERTAALRLLEALRHAPLDLAQRAAVYWALERRDPPGAAAADLGPVDLARSDALALARLLRAAVAAGQRPRAEQIERALVAKATRDGILAHFEAPGRDATEVTAEVACALLERLIGPARRKPGLAPAACAALAAWLRALITASRVSRSCLM